MPNLGAPEIVIIAIVVLILFGSKKMPDAARSLGRSLRIFKSETRGLHEDEKKGVAAPQPPVARPDDVLIDGRPLDVRPTDRDLPNGR
ncbi:MAG: Sec-independent protein translocase subunit TatA [Frankiaceae bacterium]|jgi:sec-independent protein translocase protein TatA